MIAMPYILVFMVLDVLSVLFFSLTATALLLRLALVRKHLPDWLSARPPIAFVVFALLMTSIATAARLLGGTVVFPVLAWAGFANSLVVVYRFMNKRCFLRVPLALRRLLIALLSVIVTAAAVLAVQAVVILFFVIK